MNENELTYKIRGAIFKVYNELGPGLLESVYEAALFHELQAEGLEVRAQVAVPFSYRDVQFEVGFRLDLLVNNSIIVEIKSVEALHDVHFKQVLTYLRLTKRHLGILVNFNTDKLEDKVSLVRIVNGYTPYSE